jgi:hypothetical protein
VTQEHRAFQDEIERVLPRLLALFDRDPISPCTGLGDRLYWGWKLIDYPNATPQGAVNGLARLLAANLLPPWLSHRSILERIDSAIAAAGRLVAADGSLVEAFPGESSFCVTALIAYDILSAAESLRGIADEARIAAWRRTAEPMIGFLIRHDEHHAIISNHLATAAAALTRAAAHGHPGAENRANVFLDRILHHQSPEGWFCEYGAADPGYETLGLGYLADIYCRRPDPKLEDALRRCLGFLVHAAHPDGSFGGLYGSRNTRFLVPGGLVALAPHFPEARSLASFAAQSIANRQVVTLSAFDEPNLAPMFNGYAAAACLAASSTTSLPAVDLPHQAEAPWRRLFPEAQLIFDNGPGHYTVVSIAKGGLVQHYLKHPGRVARIDPGVAARGRGRTYTTQSFRRENHHELRAQELVVEAPLLAAKTDRLTPFKMVVLRLFSLTIFHWRPLVELTKKYMVRRLVTRETPSGASNRRTIKFGESLTVEDMMTGGDALERIPVSRPFYAIHMASAGYWQRQDDEA